MKTSLVLVSRSYERLTSLSLRLSGPEHNVTLIHAKDVLSEASACPVEPNAMLVELQGTENVVALRALLERFETARILFTVPDIPASAAVARLVRSHRGALLSCEEPDIVTTATLISMAAQGRRASSHA